MNRRLGILLVCTALFAQTAVALGHGRGTSPGGAQEQGRGQERDAGQDQSVRHVQHPVAGSYIVVLSTGADTDAVERESESRHGGRRQHTYRGALNGFSMRLDRAAAEALARDPRVRYVEEDSVVEVSRTTVPWGLDRIDQRALPLDGIYTPVGLGNGVSVHVIDTGIRPTHQEFGGRAFIFADYVDDDSDGDPNDIGNDDGDPSTPDGADCHGHGTHVAGTIGGLTYGVARNVTIFAHRVLACNGYGTLSGVIAAIDDVTVDTRRPAVVNMSLGGDPSDALDDAIRQSIASGVTYVVAAGNDNVDAQFASPARVVEAITVGATDAADARAWFSNYGSVLDLFAPGVSIDSAYYTSDTAVARMSGTSMAAPHVTGVAALYLEQHPDSTPAEVRDALVSAATGNVVTNPGSGSPNLLLFTGFGEGGDLVMDDAGSPPASISPGQSFAVTDSQRNAGSADVGASVTRFYLSLDAIKSTDDILLTGSRAVPALPAGAVSTGSSTLTVPSTVPVATYTFFACADDAKQVPEINESNNCLASNVQVSVSGTLADLATTGVTNPPASGSPGTAFSVTDTVYNSGVIGASASTTRYYLSPDAVKDTGDVLLTGSRSVPALAVGAASTGARTVTVPTTAPLGTYRVLACADDLSAVRESNEANNCAASAGTMTLGWPDLLATGVSSPPAGAAPGTTFSVTDTVYNAGTVSAGASTTRYYLSLDAVKDTSDVLLTGYRSLAALAAGATSSGAKTVTVPATAPLGTYRVLACADDTLVVKESNDANNCAASAGTVLLGWPDLVATGVTNPPAGAAPGTTFSVTDTVQNAGTVSANASYTRYYLSFDAQKDTSDVLLSGTRSVATLAAGAVSSGPRTVTVPSTTPLGTYRVLACADDLSTVKESNEANNCAASAGTVLLGWPDLVTTAVTNLPAGAAPGTTFSVTDTVYNAGTVSAGASTTRYYLSLDAAKDTGDVLLTGYRSLAALAAGATSSGAKTVTVPATAPLGTYRVLACADDTLVVKESNDANNCAASAGTVLVGWPDLVATGVTNPPAAAAPGTAFSVTDTVQNAGTVSAKASYTRYYLSFDAVKDTSDVLLTGYRSLAALAVGATSSGAKTVTVPAAAPLGTYRLLACADDTLVVKESDEANNCIASATSIVIR